MTGGWSSSRAAEREAPSDSPRGHIGFRAASSVAPSACHVDCASSTIRNDDSLDLGTCDDRAAERTKQRAHRVDERCGATSSERHSMYSGGKRLKEGEEGAAGQVGREVEVHPPRRDERLHLTSLECALGQLAGRLRDEPRQLVRPLLSERATARGEQTQRPGRGKRHAQHRGEVRGDTLEPGLEAIPGESIVLGELGNRIAGLCTVGGDADEAAVRERRAKGPRRPHDLEPVREEVVLELCEERRPDEEIEVRRNRPS